MIEWKIVKVSLLPLLSELESAVICGDSSKVHVICDLLKSEFPIDDKEEK